jgi:hypothetical protein
MIRIFIAHLLPSKVFDAIAVFEHQSNPGSADGE